MTTPNFTEFDRTRAARAHEIPQIGLNRSGTIGFNQAAWDLFGPEREKGAVTAHYDAIARIIAFRATEKTNPNSFNVKIHANGTTRTISALSLIRHLKLDTSESRRYVAHAYGDMVGVDLNEVPGITTRPGRGGGRKPNSSKTQPSLLNSDVAAGD